MKREVFISVLCNINELLSIPENQRTERQSKSIKKMMARIRQSCLDKERLNSTPKWLKKLKKDPSRQPILRLCMQDALFDAEKRALMPCKPLRRS